MGSCDSPRLRGHDRNRPGIARLGRLASLFCRNPVRAGNGARIPFHEFMPAGSRSSKVERVLNNCLRSEAPFRRKSQWRSRVNWRRARGSKLRRFLRGAISLRSLAAFFGRSEVQNGSRSCSRPSQAPLLKVPGPNFASRTRPEHEV